MQSNTEHFNKMKEENIINSGNFLEVHYDNWMENQVKQTKSIFKFLDVNLTPKMIEDIQAHFSTSKSGYLSTYRGPGWDRERWRGELSMGQVRYVESKCGTQFRGGTVGEETTQGGLWTRTDGTEEGKGVTEQVEENRAIVL